MATSTNLLARIRMQKGAREMVKAMGEHMRDANAYLLVVSPDDPEERAPGLWIEFAVLSRTGEWHKEQMLFCRMKEKNHGA